MSRGVGRASPGLWFLIGVLGVILMVGLLGPSAAWAGFSSSAPAPAGLPALVKMMGPSDWGGIAVGTAIVFGILGRKLARDIQGWMR